MGNRTTAAALVLAAVMVGLCTDAAAQARGGRSGGAGRRGRGGGEIPPLLMKTDAFEDGGIIPERYAGRGGNVRPGFTFSNIPQGTVSFAIVLQDLDVAASGADGVLHWLAWNIPAKAEGVPEGVLPEGSVVGTARVGRGNYFGPGAPAGPRYHHYVFELYALSATLNLPADATRAQLLDAMKDIIVGKAAYVGRFRQ
jgi:Raf kinase inhibitor-like YbhB/YbcL family protein